MKWNSNKTLFLPAVAVLLAVGGYALFGESHVDLDKYAGVYRGISYADESPLESGEAEFSIKKNVVTLTIALGNRILFDVVDTASVVVATGKEMEAVFTPRPIPHGRLEGFKADGLTFVFIRDAQDYEPGLLIQPSDEHDLRGPAILFTPAQVSRGVHDRFIASLAAKHGNKLPLIENMGRPLARD